MYIQKKFCLRHPLCFIALAFTVMLGVTSSANAATEVYDFEAPDVLTSYEVGDRIETAAATIRIKRFKLANNLWESDGVAKIQATNHAFGSESQELRLSNISFRVTPRSPASRLQFRYADKGGNVNFAVNGVFHNVDDLRELHNRVVGEVGVFVTEEPRIIAGNEEWVYGIVELVPLLGSTINAIRVGGAWFFVDDMEIVNE